MTTPDDNALHLEAMLAKCLSPGDNAISIGGELFFCGAAATGVLLK